MELDQTTYEDEGEYLLEELEDCDEDREEGKQNANPGRRRKS